MAQTPQQRRANAQYARSEERKMGRSRDTTVATASKKEKKEKPPISPFWVYMMIFVVCGGIIFELLRMILTGASSFL